MSRYPLKIVDATHVYDLVTERIFHKQKLFAKYTSPNPDLALSDSEESDNNKEETFLRLQEKASERELTKHQGNDGDFSSSEEVKE
jgi:hypothetical protein